MQKKLIALAVAGLMSAPVMAQSNVQIYGVMDVGVAHWSSSDSGLANRTAIDSGNQAPSRIGFQGTEDLGNGLKAFFKIEQGLNADRDATPTNRQIYVGLQGGFGAVRLGRDFNPARQLITGLDPFGAVGVGSVQNVYSLTTRYDNAIMYKSPNFGGFMLEAAYSNDISGNEINNDNKDKGWSIVPKYKNGPLSIGAAYERQKDRDLKRWNIAGSYNFGIVDLRAAFGETDIDGDDIDNVMIAAVAPISEAGSLLASVTRAKADDAKATQWAIGYKHSLSKRTNVYATYSKMNTNDEAEGLYSVGGLDYTTGINLGIRHNF